VEQELLRQMANLTFYHTIPLTPTLSTPGWPIVVPIVEMTSRVLRTLDLRGKRVLDVGCRDGLFSFEAEKLGAAEVIGIDNDLSPGVPEFLTRCLRSRVRFHSFNLFDLRPETFGRFDVVLFPGVLYHLRYPFWALRLLRDVLADGGLLLLETAILADANRRALLFCPVGEDSPYEPTSCTFFNRKGLHDTLGSLGLRVERWQCLMNPNAHATGDSDEPLIDRCVTLCRKPAGIDADQNERYWDGAIGEIDVPIWDGTRRDGGAPYAQPPTSSRA
jgi:tRNA (mo5U34)-methyltransferase